MERREILGALGVFGAGHRLRAARCSTAKRYERVRTSVDGRWHGQFDGGEEVAGSV